MPSDTTVSSSIDRVEVSSQIQRRRRWSKWVAWLQRSVDLRNHAPPDPRRRHEENGMTRGGSSRHPWPRPWAPSCPELNLGRPNPGGRRANNELARDAQIPLGQEAGIWSGARPP